jgi:hypothetical protein
MAIDAFLMGDSHMGTIRAGAKELGLEIGGGITIPFGFIFRGALKADADKGFVFTDVDMDYAHPVSYFEEQFWKEMKRVGYSRIADIDVPLITDIGCNPAGIVSNINRFSFDPNSDKRFIPRAIIREMLEEKLGNQIAVVRWLHENLPQTVFVSPPNAAGYSRENWQFCIRHLFGIYAGFGAKTYSPDNWATFQRPLGGIKPEYLTGVIRNGHEDLVHGNATFGAKVMQDCLGMVGVTLPQAAE